MSAKEKLKEVFENYESLKIICNDAKEKIYRNPGDSFAKKILQKGDRKTKDKKVTIERYFDSLLQRITEHFILELVAAFEHIVFTRIDNAHGEIESIVTDEYNKRRLKKNKPTPFYIAVSDFIRNKEDFYSLSGLKKLLENKIPEDLFEDLKEIIDYRNWLSHGKRTDVGQKSTLQIDEIYEILIDILNEIDKV